MCFSWSWDNEGEGTCFLQGPHPLQSHRQPTTRVRARGCFLNVRGCHWGGGGLQTATELSHPLSFPLPDPWWVLACLSYCLRSANKRWKFDGTFQVSLPPFCFKKKKKVLMSWSFCLCYLVVTQTWCRIFVQLNLSK